MRFPAFAGQAPPQSAFSPMFEKRVRYFSIVRNVILGGIFTLKGKRFLVKKKKPTDIQLVFINSFSQKIHHSFFKRPFFLST